MIDRSILAQISQAAYGPIWGGKPNPPPNGWTSIVSTEKSATGFQGTFYQNASGQIVVVFAGTNDLTDFTLNNLNVAFDRIPQQYQDALNLYNKALALAGGDINKVTITGHSLGGILAQLVGAKSGSPTTTFNSIGSKVLLSSLGLDPNKNYSNINNFSLANDALNLTSISNNMSFVGAQYIIPSTGNDPFVRAVQF